MKNDNVLEDYLFKMVKKVIDESKEYTPDSLIDYDGDDKIISSREIAQIISQEEAPEWQLRLGLPSIDEALGGVDPGNLVIISAPTGNGKTKLSETLTVNFYRQHVNSLWFTFEMPPKQLLKRFGSNIPMFYLPQEIKSNAMTWLEARIAEAIAKHQVKAVFIDHLHFLFDLAGNSNVSLALGSVVRKIKRLALKYNLAIFLIAHTTKVGYKDQLGLHSIRDSSFVAQEADAVLMLSREFEEDIQGRITYLDRTVISLEKNRKYGTFSKAICRLKHNIFVEITERMSEREATAESAKNVFV